MMSGTIYQLIRLFMESKNISVLFLYHKANVSCVFYYVAVKRNFIIVVSKLEQPSCLKAWVNLGQKLYLNECPSSW